MSKRELTKEQLADAHRLEAIFLAKKEEAKARGEKISQESIAFRCGWNTQGNFNSYMKGRKAIGLEAGLLMAEALGVSLADISPSLASHVAKVPIDGQSLESMNMRPVVDMDETSLDDDEFEVTHYREVYATGGHNELPALEAITEKVKVKKEVARRAGASMTHSFSFNLDGNSMSPKILDKAHCTADGSKKQVKDGRIYVFRHGVMRRTKYLYNLPNGGLLIRSENKEEFPDEIIDPKDMGDIEILGWVYQWCNVEVW